MIFFSNQLEKLLPPLKDNLFKDSSPFAKRIIIVPNAMVKSWLLLQLAKDKDLQIAMGLQFFTLESGIHFIYEYLTDEKVNHPQFLELTLFLEQEIYEIIHGTTDPLFDPLKEYLKNSEKRVHALAKTLSHLFLSYGSYGKHLTLEWENEVPKTWQHALWKKIFGKEGYFDYPYRTFLKTPFQMKDLKIHFFGIPYLSPLQMQFISTLSCSFYLLSPSKMFWEDTLSKNDIFKLQPHIHQNLFEELLETSSPLLANCGKLGKRMLKQLEVLNAPFHETYTLSAATLAFKEYQELYYEDMELQKKPFTLLQGIQSDLLLLRPQSKLHIPFDNSLTIHNAPNRYREVEILYDNLLQIMHQKKIVASDILVYATDLSDYIPYIEGVFNHAQSKIQAEIMEKPKTNAVLTTFLKFLDFSTTKWELQSFLNFFEHPHFYKKHHFKEKNVLEIIEYLIKADIRWGKNVAHRDAILKREHALSDIKDKTAFGTWDSSFQKLFFSFVFDAKRNVKTLPYVKEDFAENLGKIKKIIEAIYRDLQFQNQGYHWSIEKWSCYLLSLFEAYFEIEGEGKESFELITEKLQNLQNFSKKLNSGLFPYASFKSLLLESLNAEKDRFKENLQAVRFLPLKTTCAIPAKVVALIGCEDEIFPRKNFTISLNELDRKDKDQVPSDAEWDRSLFLEAILSCKDNLLLSYSGYSSHDGKDQMSSLLITELLEYVDTYFLMDGVNPSTKISFKHPFNSFHHSYFESDSPLKSVRKENFRKALSLYQPEKEPLKPFLNPFHIQDLPPQVEAETLSIKELLNFAKNPLKSYFKASFGLSLENYSRSPNSEETFEIDPLLNYELSKGILKTKTGALIENAEKKGMLPTGPFKEFFVDKFTGQAKEVEKYLTSLNVEKFYTLSFSETVLEVSNHLHQIDLPALKIPYENKVISIVGSLSISKDGLFIHKAYNKSECFKICLWR